MAGRRPDYVLRAIKKNPDGKPIGRGITLGAAWKDQTSKAIDIRIDAPCIAITDTEDIFLKLFPAEEEPEEKKPPRPAPYEFIPREEPEPPFK